METYIIGGTFAVILVAIGGYFLARFMKGSVDLELARSAAESGQPLTGQAKLTAKRPIRGLLRVSLVGRDKRRQRRGRHAGAHPLARGGRAGGRRRRPLDKTQGGDQPAGLTDTG